jgi:hypothetical protein
MSTGWGKINQKTLRDLSFAEGKQVSRGLLLDYTGENT